MTRKDWWLGILIVLIAPLIQTLVLVHFSHTSDVAQARIGCLPRHGTVPQTD